LAISTNWAPMRGASVGLKPLAFLRAFTDDSASEIGDRRLFFAGFIHRAEQWALFAQAWNAELNTEPAIEYLKMSEAQNLKKQFRGWSKEHRDAKLLALARVVFNFRPFSFQFSIDRRKFDQILKPVSPRGLGNPHFTCCFGIVSGVTRFSAQQGGNVPIEFVFDTQDGVDIDFKLWFEAMKTSLPRKVRKLFSGTPSFKNDLDLVQLQAADMLAWHLRREHENNENDMLPALKLLRRPGEHLLCGEIDEPMMTKWADHHSKLPAVKILKSKTQWRNFKINFAYLLSSGFIPPRGSRWKNTIYFARERLARLIGL
jgi:hypothetical protein